MTSPVPTTDPDFPAQWLPLAERICEQYYTEFPDHVTRYGDRGRDFCAHDNAYLIQWLVDSLDITGGQTFERNVAWLRSVLVARAFPPDAFARNLTLVAAAVTELRPEDTERIESLMEAVASESQEV